MRALSPILVAASFPFAESHTLELALPDTPHFQVVRRYVHVLRSFSTLPAEVAHGVCMFLSRLVKQCKLEPMLFTIDSLLVYDEVLQHPASKLPQHKEVGRSSAALFVSCLLLSITTLVSLLP